LWDNFLKAEKLWQILKIGHTDFKKAEHRKDVRINMQCWIVKASPAVNNLFGDEEEFEGYHVSMAGAVLLRRAEEAPNSWPEWIDDEARTKLVILDLLRMGQVYQAARLVGHRKPKIDIVIPNYHLEKDLWWDKQKYLLERLKGAAL